MNCFRRNPRLDPNLGWHSREKEMLNNPLYQLMDVNMGGLLVRSFEEDGFSGVLRICKTYIQDHYLYHRGTSTQSISLYDYTIWRGSVKASGIKMVDGFSKDYSLDRLVRFKEHHACCNLSKRGIFGETILHLCYINNSPVHNEIAKILLEIYPKLSIDIFEGEEFYGESALHLAIVNGDLDSVKVLVEKGANVNQPTTGHFFLPEDQKVKRSNCTNYEGYAYYGEYPLSFAACFGHQSIYDYLIQNGADPNNQDTYGNTVLHMIVISDQPEMYSHAIKHPIKAANAWIKNGEPGSDDGLTPLSLASKLGRQQIFNEITENHRVELWRYSNICCSLYPLYEIDSIGIGGQTNWNSALMHIVNQDTDDHLEMLQGGLIRQLLDEKWRTFIKGQFFKRLLFICAHLLLLTVAICLRPRHDLVEYENTQDHLRSASEIIVVLMCMTNLLLNYHEIRALGFYLFLVNQKNAPSKAIFLVSCMLILLCLPVRLIHLFTENHSSHHVLQEMEEKLLIIAVPFAWWMLLFFAKGHSLTGTSVMMFYKILIGDLLRFVVIYIIFLINFGQSFYLLFKNSQQTRTFTSPGGSLMDLMHWTLGSFTYAEFNDTVYPPLTQAMFVIFMMVMPILLLNMLIAMMGNTYTSIIAKSEKEWIRQWAKIVLILERSFSKEKLLMFQNQYSLSIDNPPKNDAEYMKKIHGEGVEYRALMVIKTTGKTMAKQRKGAIHNWKWLIKEMIRRIKEVKKKGYTGKITYQKVFPSEYDLMNEAAFTRRISGINRRLSGLFTGESEPNWTAAVEQLAWEKDLNLSANGLNMVNGNNSGPSPLDQVNLLDEDELDVIIQEAAHNDSQEETTTNYLNTARYMSARSGSFFSENSIDTILNNVNAKS